MLRLNKQEQHYVDIAQHLELSELDYHVIMRQHLQHTYLFLSLGGALFIIACVLFIAEIVPAIKGFGVGLVTLFFLLGLICIFHAMRYQKEIETRVTYEILLKIHAIEGENGFLWKLNPLINAYCNAQYGGLPDGVQQLQTSSQSGGIEMSEIHLYKELLERAIKWYQAQQPEEGSNNINA
ncbi:MAG: hypothetical protein B6I36_06370 [Desulfobacteraceae bacterium 4572_35.1]|nr:MAG: hypothetical protein B6I36_06370 [Desulfobacteraceae bacterium 4572_35.1]